MADNNVDKLKIKDTDSFQMELRNEGAEESENMEGEKRSEESAVASGTKRKHNEEEVSSPKPKIMINFAGSAKKSSPISLSFNKQGIEKKSKEKQGESLLKKQTGSVAAAFAADGSDDEEEMPKEAKMRMKNLGKDTVTSSGPNSFNKGRKGFVDHLKVWEKTMKVDRPTASKIRDKT